MSTDDRRYKDQQGTYTPDGLRQLADDSPKKSWNDTPGFTIREREILNQQSEWQRKQNGS